MSPLRSVAGRLALALLIVVAGVLAIVYLIVVPSYRNSLEHTELNSLETAMRGTAIPNFPSELYLQQRFASSVAPRVNARVVVFDLLSDTPTPLEPAADSNLDGFAADVENDPVAFEAAQHQTLARGTVMRHGQTFAEVAYPVGDAVILLSAPLHDQLQAVSLVRSRVLVAGALALAFAVALGYAGASLFARRIRRLEAAADRIAAGNFDEAVVRPRLGRARPARAHVRADAPAPGRPRPRARRVHRERLARAADAALLARRLPRAARRPVPRRGDPRGVPRPDARAGGPPDEARHRPARPLAPRRGPPDRDRGAGRPLASWRSSSSGSSAPRARCCRPSARSSLRSARCSRSATSERVLQIGRVLRRERARAHARGHGGARLDRPSTAAARPSASPTTARGSPPSRPAADLPALLPPRRHARVGQRASGSRSPASWRR